MSYFTKKEKYKGHDILRIYSAGIYQKHVVSLGLTKALFFLRNINGIRKLLKEEREHPLDLFKGSEDSIQQVIMWERIKGHSEYYTLEQLQAISLCFNDVRELVEENKKGLNEKMNQRNQERRKQAAKKAKDRIFKRNVYKEKELKSPGTFSCNFK